MSVHALMHAADSGRFSEVKELVEGSHVNAMWRKKDGRTYNPNATPLLYAARSGHLDIVEYLVDHGALINAKDIENWTALHYSCNNGHEEIVQYLILHGIETDMKDTFLQQTALEFARYRQFHRVVQILAPDLPEFVRKPKDINSKGIKPIFARNSTNFLFRYSFKEKDAPDKLMTFRKTPAHAPLTLLADDVELGNLQVSLNFDHDFDRHRAQAQLLRHSSSLVRSSTLSTNEHMNVYIFNQ